MKKVEKRYIVTITFFLILSLLFSGTLFFHKNYKANAIIADINSTKLSNLGTLANGYKDLIQPVERIANKTTNSTQGGYNINNLFDGNDKTMWSSVWDPNNIDESFIDFNFYQIENISGFYEITRQDNNAAGIPNSYKILVSKDGYHWEETGVAGKLPTSIGKWEIHFKQPIRTKFLRLVLPEDGTCLSELRFFYMPSSLNDLQSLKNETDRLMSKVIKGDAFDTYSDANFNDIQDSYTAALQMAEDNDENISKKAEAYFDLVKKIKRNITIQVDQQPNYSEKKNLYNNARMFFDAAEIGDEPLYWPDYEISAFEPIINEAERIFSEQFVLQGDYDDMSILLEREFPYFQKAVNKPKVIADDFVADIGGMVGAKIDALYDGLFETRWQINVNEPSNFNGTKWITFDYGNDINIDGLLISSWFAQTQAVKSFRFEYFDSVNSQWKTMLPANGQSNGGIFDAGKWTTNVQPSETHVIKMKSQKSSKFRFSPTGHMGNVFCGIDELALSVVVSPEDINVSISFENDKVVEGGKIQLKSLVIPHYLTNKDVTWTSSNTAVATVDANGVVSAISTGGKPSVDITITATSKANPQKKANITISVLMKQIEDEDKQVIDRLYEMEDKYSKVQKESDYQQGALKEYQDKLLELSDLSQVQSIGDISKWKANIEKIHNDLMLKSIRVINNVKALINRVAGEGYGDKFDIQIIPAEAQTGNDVWEVDWNDASNKPVLRGNNAVSLATAFNYYLKYYCYQSYSYVTMQDYDITMPKALPKVDEKVHNVFPYEYRHYFNVNCEYKYSVVNYSQKDWQHRMDWMAMNGYNMFLFDFDYRAVWLKMAEDGVLGDAFVESSPKYNPDAMKELQIATLDKQPMMGNFALSKESIRKSGELGSQVLQMAFDLGIEPEVRPFYGALPFMFPNNHNDYYGALKPNFTINLPNSVFDGVDAYLAAKWVNSPQGIALSPYTVPNSTFAQQEKAMQLFTFLSDKYYEYYMKVYPFDKNGLTLKYVYKDLVEEQGFVIKHAAYPNKTLDYLEEQFQKLNPKGKWIVSSWTIQQWELDHFSPEKTLVIDLNSDKSGSTHEFWGTQWMWCVLYNYGGNQGLGHDLASRVTQFAKLKQNSKILSGFALGPEGSDTDPLFYDFMSEFSWRDDLPTDINQAKVFLRDWMKNYAKRRYGLNAYNSASDLFDELMMTLVDTYYSRTLAGFPQQSVINGMPKISGTQARPNGNTMDEPWSFKTASEMFGMVANLVNTIKPKEQNKNFLYDMTDISRQVLAELALPIYKKIAPNYSKANIEKAKQYTKMIIDIINDMDALLATNPDFLFGTRIAGARNRGANEVDSAYFELVERTYVTFWMADNAPAIWSVYDYANKQLAGYLKDWCAVRWTFFYEQLDRASKEQSFPDIDNFNRNYQNIVVSQTNDYVGKWAYQPYNVYYNAHKDTENLSTPFYGQDDAVYIEYAVKPQGDNALAITNTYKKYAPYLTALYEKQNSVDKSALQELYNTSLSTQQGDAGEIEWKNFLDARDYAKEIIDTDNVENGQVNVALSSLKRAIINLSNDEKLEAKLELQELYAKYSAIDKDLYTKDTILVLDTALEQAKNVLDSDNVVVNDILTATENLENAFIALEIDAKKGKQVLQAEIDRLSQIKPNDYTFISFKRLTKAIENAKKILKDENITGKQIQNNLMALKEAEENLQKAEAIVVDKKDLQTLFDMSKMRNSELYTADSWNAFKSAYDNATAVLANENASQADVNSAKDQLQNAYDGLTEQVQKGGCGSFLSGQTSNMFILLAVVCTAILLSRKKEY